MKKIFYIFLITHLTVVLSFSQSGWVIQNYANPVYTLHTVFFNDVNTGYTVGELGLFLQTTNGGINWIRKTIGSTLDFRCVYFIDPSTGFVTAFHGNDYKSQILKTTNGGGNWELRQYVPGLLTTCVFVNNSTGFLAGGCAGVYKTTDAGSNWVFIYYGTNVSFNDIFFLNESTGFAAGGDYTSGFISRIWKTSNGGLNWIQLSNALNLGYYYETIFFVNNNTGFAGGVDRVVKTTDGGNNWTLYGSPLSYINSIVFVNQNTGYASGHMYIYKTTNCGVNWSQQAHLDSLSLADIFFVTENTGYTVGAYSVILKTTSGGEPIGIQPISTEIPIQFTLFQNYPNPFNPTTKIKFQIPASPLSIGEGQGVRLVIYDLLGREVAVLVNEQLSPGTYDVQWPATGGASSFASGVYFYQLRTDRFTEAKKMVLIR